MIGGHTLSDIARELDVSRSWIGKIEERFKLNLSSGVKGLRCEYSRSHVDIFRRINILRRLGFSLKYIFDFYSVHVDIIHKVNTYFNSNNVVGSPGVVREIVLFFPIPSIEYSTVKYKLLIYSSCNEHMLDLSLLEIELCRYLSEVKSRIIISKSQLDVLHAACSN